MPKLGGGNWEFVIDDFRLTIYEGKSGVSSHYAVVYGAHKKQGQQTDLMNQLHH